MNRIQVALFSNREKAEPLRSRLVQAGMQAEVHEELRLEKLWYVPKQSAGARLEVPAEQFERAYQLLLDWDTAEAALREAIRCPECKSLRVDYPQFTRKSFITNVVMGLAAELHLMEKEYYCQDCHFTWPKEGTKPRRDRQHMSPHYFIEGVVQTGAQEQAGASGPRQTV